MSRARCTMRDVVRTGVTVLIAALAAALATAAGAAPATIAMAPASATSATRATSATSSAVTAIVLRDQTSLRAAPRDSAPQLAVLWQGEALEVRGERLDYLQVWDHVRERGRLRPRQPGPSQPPRRGGGAGPARAGRLHARIGGQRGARHRPHRRLPGSRVGRRAAQQRRRRGVRRPRHVRRPARPAHLGRQRAEQGGRGRDGRPPRGGDALRRPLRELRARRPDADLLRRRCVSSRPRARRRADAAGARHSRADASGVCSTGRSAFAIAPRSTSGASPSSIASTRASCRVM